MELIALVLVCRDSSTSEVAAVTAEPYRPPHVEAAAQEALAAGSMIALFDSPPTDAESAILYHSVQREITLRNPVYPHMLLDTLRGLFSDPTVNEDRRAAVGFTGLEAVKRGGSGPIAVEYGVGEAVHAHGGRSGREPAVHPVVAEPR
jgi:hypothetical protein